MNRGEKRAEKKKRGAQRRATKTSKIFGCVCACGVTPIFENDDRATNGTFRVLPDDKKINFLCTGCRLDAYAKAPYCMCGKKRSRGEGFCSSECRAVGVRNHGETYCFDLERKMREIAPSVKYGVVYILKNPISGEIQYVGSTKNEKRREQCYRNLSGSSKKVTRWLVELYNQGISPTFEVVERCPDDLLLRAERSWYDYLVDGGHNLLNTVSAGKRHVCLKRETTIYLNRKGWPKGALYSKTEDGQPMLVTTDPLIAAIISSDKVLKEPVKNDVDVEIFLDRVSKISEKLVDRQGTTSRVFTPFTREWFQWRQRLANEYKEVDG